MSKPNTVVFLSDLDGPRESVGLDLPFEINGWLNDTVQTARRKRIEEAGRIVGKPIPKQILIQAAIELLKSAPVDLTEVESVEELQDILYSLSRKMNR